jgi:hypothetical protein
MPEHRPSARFLHVAKSMISKILLGIVLAAAKITPR